MKQKSYRFDQVCRHFLCVTSLSLVTSTLTADIPIAPHVVIDSSGTKVAVWEMDGSTSSIRARVNSSSSWDTEATISDSQDAFAPQLINNADGDVIAAWMFLDTINGVYSIATSTMTSGSWASPQIVTGTTESVAEFKLQINPEGEAILIWTSYNTISEETHVWVSTSTFPGSWTTPAQLSSS